MITYSSPGFRVTWTSVDEHIKNDLDLQSTAQEEEAIILVAESMREGTRRALNRIAQLRLRNLVPWSCASEQRGVGQQMCRMPTAQPCGGRWWWMVFASLS